MIIGHGVVGPGEADRYMEGTLREFARLCDDVILCLNHAGEKERKLIKKYGFKTVEDDREWGLYQHKIKEDFLRNHVAKLKPDFCITLDMDEVFDPKITKEDFKDVVGGYVFLVNMWDDPEHYMPSMCFWDIRYYKFGDLTFENQPLHCGMAPKIAYHQGTYLPIFVKHYGLMTKATRFRKVERYDKYDPHAKYKNKAYYDSLLSTNPSEPFDDDMMRRMVQIEVGTYGSQIKQIVMQPEKKFVLVKRMADGAILDLNEEEWTQIQRDPNRKTEFVFLENVGAVTSVPAEAPVKDPLECEVCGFVSKAEVGFKSHARTHNPQ